MATLFTGTSRYSSDFSSIIDRQVAIASLPLKQLQQGRAKSSDRLTAFRTIEAKILSLQSAMKGVEDGVTSSALKAGASDPSLVSVSASEGVATGSYNLRVESLGSYSTAVGNSNPGNPVSAPNAANFVTAGTTEINLRVTDHNTGTPSTTTKTINLNGGTSLQSVVDAINHESGLNVKAAIVNVGGSDTPNYVLSLQSTKLGRYALQVADNTTNLMNVDENNANDGSLGTQAKYIINGSTVYSQSRTVTLAPKLTANLLKASPGTDISVAVTESTSSVESAMTSFISAFNGVLDQLDNFSGKGGVLAGDSLVSTLRQQLHSVVDRTAGQGSLTTLAQAGIEFTSGGRLSFNSTLFSSATVGKFSDLKSLIGTSTTSGFMKVATGILNGIETANGQSGFLNDAIQSMDASLKKEDSAIEQQQNRIDKLTTDLQDRMAAADALIAGLEQQATYMTNMFQAMAANAKNQ